MAPPGQTFLVPPAVDLWSLNWGPPGASLFSSFGRWVSPGGPRLRLHAPSAWRHEFNLCSRTRAPRALWKENTCELAAIRIEGTPQGEAKGDQ